MELEIWHYWYIASMALLLSEALLVPGVGFLFAAVAALCMGALVQLGMIASGDMVAQGTAFFFLTAIWAVVLWKPLKKFRMQGSNSKHHDMVGRMAIVDVGGVEKGRNGRARWSGTIMSARLAADSKLGVVAEGTELKIVDVRGSTLILAEPDYEIQSRD